jgi:hypothetical protein
LLGTGAHTCNPAIREAEEEEEGEFKGSLSIIAKPSYNNNNNNKLNFLCLNDSSFSLD